METVKILYRSVSGDRTDANRDMLVGKVHKMGAERGARVRLDVRNNVRYNVVKEYKMTTLSATEARKDIYKLMDKVAEEKKPILITKKDGNNAMLISEKEWSAMQETLYLLSIPGMREELIEGLHAPLSEYEDITEGIDWENV